MRTSDCIASEAREVHQTVRLYSGACRARKRCVENNPRQKLAAVVKLRGRAK